MKNCIVFLLVIYVNLISESECLTPNQIADIIEFQTLCAKETGVSQDVLLKARKGQFSEDQKLKQHMHCVSKKHGFQTDDGTIQEAVLEQKVGEAIDDIEMAKIIYSQCAKKESSPIETSFMMQKCYFEKTGISIA